MYDLALLKAFTDREIYTKYRGYVTEKEFDRELIPILRSIDSWYGSNTGSVALEEVANLAFAKFVPEKDWEPTKQIFQTLRNMRISESAIEVLRRFKKSRICENLSLAAYRASQGQASISEVFDLVEQLEKPVEEVQYVKTDILSILRETTQTQGLRWRLDSLNKSLGSLRKGDFGFVFARPETGKTTFLASEVTHMATQIKSGPVLWYNNEEQGTKVLLRCYEAALGASLQQIKKYPERAQAAFNRNNGNLIKVVDSSTIDRYLVEQVCNRENPSLIIFDQLDKIKGFKADREDLVQGEIYKWAREIAKTYAPVIGVCQADATAEGEKWLFMDHVSNAKTAKQAEADWILGIGKSHSPGFEYVRFFNICKNKLVGDEDTDPARRHTRFEAIIEPEIARYKDV